MSHAKLVLQVQLLAAYLRENDVMVCLGTFCSQSLDKNTVLGLNTKFSFLNNITGSGSKCFYLVFFLVSVTYWLIYLLLTFPLCMETRWIGIFQKLCYQLFQGYFVSLKKGFFSHFSWWKPILASSRTSLQRNTFFPGSSIFLQILILEMELWWSEIKILAEITAISRL